MAFFISDNDGNYAESGRESNIKPAIKKILKIAGRSLTKTVEIMNEKFPDSATTFQNINNKLTSGTIRFSEVEKIAEICGFHIVFVPNNSAKRCNIVEEHANGILRTKFIDAVLDGYAFCESPNFGNHIIAGKLAESAAEWLNSNIKNDMSDLQEMLLISHAINNFHVFIKPTGVDNHTQKDRRSNFDD